MNSAAINNDSRTVHTVTSQNVALNDEQLRIYNMIKREINTNLSSINTDIDNDYDSDNDSEHSHHSEHMYPSAPFTIDISETNIHKSKSFLVIGKPGTGKSLVLHHLIEFCLSKEIHILFTSPTANLARRTNILYQSKYITCDTVHAAFRIPIDGGSPTINPALYKYNVIAIEEVGMISSTTMGHIFNSIDSLPFPICLVLVGDEFQQAPFTSQTSSVTTNIYQSELIRRCTRLNLIVQHRVECKKLDKLLAVMRSSYLTLSEANYLNQELCSSDTDDLDKDIQNCFRRSPQFITLSRFKC